jgi:uncharacterized protein (TIGR01777 family)
MTILIIGASGFIGRHLADHLHSHHHRVAVASRDAGKAAALLGNRFQYIEWDGARPDQLIPHLKEIDAVVNLAGENLAGGRWTSCRKERLVSSRVTTGKALAEAILAAEKRPDVLIQGSATGIYGLCADKPAGETREEGTGFLADLTRQWESSVSSLEDTDIRLVYIRTGLVLGKESGILPRLDMSFASGTGVIPGSGDQWLSWIHILDHVDAIRFLIENPTASGVFNLTAPNPVTMRQMVRTLGRIRNRPVWLHIPSFVLKMMFGRMAEETILSSQDILPEALMDAGYAFHYLHIEDALRNLLNK